MSLDRILVVDDDPNLLDGMQNQLRKLFFIETALGGEDGLQKLAKQAPFAVVVADMRMPGMDGARFLARVRETYPDTVRVMLTGNANLDTAVAAVNKGSIFQFVSKPCPADVMKNVLDASVRQYRLVMAEKDLLEKTLKGSIKGLVDILAVTNPVAFSRAMRIKHFVAQLTQLLHLSDAWKFEVAAMLSHVGYVTVPPETLERAMTGGKLSGEEQKMVASCLDVAKGLVENIPRLEPVAGMISLQAKRFDEFAKTPDLAADPEVAIGAQLLKAAIDFDACLAGGMSAHAAAGVLADRKGAYSPAILSVLQSVTAPVLEKTTCPVKIADLLKGMTLAEDIRDTNGLLIVTKGQEVNEILRKRLENFHLQGRIPEFVLAHTFVQRAP